MTNKGSYLALNYSGTANPVKYNDRNVYCSKKLEFISLHLHTYYAGANSADGEILIIHNGSWEKFNRISVPFVSGGKTDKGSAQLGFINYRKQP